MINEEYNRQPLISVIVPIYNVEIYLDKCVNSIVNQTYKNLEILLIDDGSPDNCPNMCEIWKKKDNRINVIHKENGGLSSARNTGLDNCNGEFVSFIDSDDWVDERFIEKLYIGISTSEADISVVGGWRVYSDRMVNYTEGLEERIFSQKETIYSYLYFRNNLVGGVADKLFKRNLFDDIRFPLGLTSEDRYTWALICDRVSRLYFNPEPLYYYVCREGSISNSKLNESAFDTIKITDMICEHLEETGFSDKSALDFFRMKANLDMLYKMLVINAPESYIKEYMHNTRKYFWKIIINKEVSINFKIKYVCFCFFPKKYEAIKRIIKKR